MVPGPRAARCTGDHRAVKGSFGVFLPFAQLHFLIPSPSPSTSPESEVFLLLWECVINTGRMEGRVPGSYSWLWPHSGMCPEVE